MTPRVCAPTRGMRRSGRCRSGNASRTRPTTGRAVRRPAHRQHRRPDFAGRDFVGHHRHVDAAAPHDLHGRPRAPSPNAQHSWQGFSTGEWEGDMLKVTTTHLKEGWVRRNGLPRSDKATLIEYFIRNERLSDARHGRHGSRSISPSRWCARPTGCSTRASAQPVLLHSRRSRSSARAARCRITCPAPTRSDRVRDSAWVAVEASRGGARRRCIPTIRRAAARIEAAR